MVKRSLRKSAPQPFANVAEPIGASESAVLTPLNFKVPQAFHREFKTFAAQHSKKMVEVLQEAFALLKEKHGS
ncbi:MAG: hypothetical protein WCF26_04850 [Candidatus Sulfotelmatobacter sp.]